MVISYSESRLNSWLSYFVAVLSARQRYLLGLLLKLTSFFLPLLISVISFGFLWYTNFIAEGDARLLPTILLLIFYLPFCCYSILLLPISINQLSDRLMMPSADEVLTKDTRPPILYLRSFEDEDAGKNLWDVQETEEKFIRHVLRKAGPLIAIGKPGEALPPLGITRLYLSSESNWQEEVKNLIERAQLVIISPDISPGLLWEVLTAFQVGSPEKVVISLVNYHVMTLRPSINVSKSKQRYKEFRKAFQKKVDAAGLPVQLPEEIGHATFMYFNTDWTPILSDYGRIDEPETNLRRIAVNKGINVVTGKQSESLYSRLLIIMCAVTLLINIIVFPLFVSL